MQHLNLASKYIEKFIKFMELSTQIYIDAAENNMKIRDSHNLRGTIFKDSLGAIS